MLKLVGEEGTSLATGMLLLPQSPSDCKGTRSHWFGLPSFFCFLGTSVFQASLEPKKLWDFLKFLIFSHSLVGLPAKIFHFWAIQVWRTMGRHSILHASYSSTEYNFGSWQPVFGPKWRVLLPVFRLKKQIKETLPFHVSLLFFSVIASDQALVSLTSIADGKPLRFFLLNVYWIQDGSWCDRVILKVHDTGTSDWENWVC